MQLQFSGWPTRWPSWSPTTYAPAWTVTLAASHAPRWRSCTRTCSSYTGAGRRRTLCSSSTATGVLTAGGARDTGGATPATPLGCLCLPLATCSQWQLHTLSNGSAQQPVGTGSCWQTAEVGVGGRGRVSSASVCVLWHPRHKVQPSIRCWQALFSAALWTVCSGRSTTTASADDGS